MQLINSEIADLIDGHHSDHDHHCMINPIDRYDRIAVSCYGQLVNLKALQAEELRRVSEQFNVIRFKKVRKT